MKRPHLYIEHILLVKQVIRDLFFNYKFEPVHKLNCSKKTIILEERRWLAEMEDTFNREINRNADTKIKLLLEDVYSEYLNKIDEEKEESELEAERCGSREGAIEEEKRVYEVITDLHTYNEWTRSYLKEVYEVTEDFYNRHGSIFFTQQAA